MSIHITPHLKGWQVKSENSSKAYRVVTTQEEAIKIAKVVAKNNFTDIKIHGKNGQVRVGHNYSKN